MYMSFFQTYRWLLICWITIKNVVLMYIKDLKRNGLDRYQFHFLQGAAEQLLNARSQMQSEVQSFQRPLDALYLCQLVCWYVLFAVRVNFPLFWPKWPNFLNSPKLSLNVP